MAELEVWGVGDGARGWRLGKVGLRRVGDGDGVRADRAKYPTGGCTVIRKERVQITGRLSRAIRVLGLGIQGLYV